jgi:ABC-2 type transport system ATP-binding protein
VVRPPSPIRTADVKPAQPLAPAAAAPAGDFPDDFANEAATELSPDVSPATASAVAMVTAVAAPPVEAPAPPAAFEETPLREAPIPEAPIQKVEVEPAPARAAPAPAAPALAVPLRTAPLRTAPVRSAAPASPAARPISVDVALSVIDLSKSFGTTKAADSIELEVRAGSLFGMVGPNGAGKTTTLSMISGLLRPDSGVVRVYGADVWANPAVAKKSLGVLPDRLRLFDRLTGAEFLHHAGALHGLDRTTVTRRAADLAAAFGLQNSMHRLVSDFSVGLTKKIAIAAAMIHSPRLLVLDEPFESVDPVSAAMVIDILRRFTDAGGTVLLSSHSMELIERVCDSVAIIADGHVLIEGPLEDVVRGSSLEARFVELAGGTSGVEGMEWLQSFSD